MTTVSRRSLATAPRKRGRGCTLTSVLTFIVYLSGRGDDKLCHHLGRPRALSWTRSRVPPKTQTLVRGSQRISCNPTRTQIVDAPALVHDPVYGPKTHNGFNTPFQRGAPPLPWLSVASPNSEQILCKLLYFFRILPSFFSPPLQVLMSLSF